MKAPQGGVPGAPSTPPTIGGWHRAAIGIGNGLEFYDFSISAFFAVAIGRAFFPVSDPWTSLLLSVSSIGIGYVARPLGALVIGAYADRRGRKPAMLASMAMMALGSLGIAILPGPAVLGVAAPVLLIALRLLQGFAIGGETGSAVSILFEAAAPGGQGRAMVWAVATNGAGLLAAGIVGFALSVALPAARLDAWGWRCAMALGLAIMPVALAVRAGLPDIAPPPRPARSARAWSARARAGQLVAVTLVIASGNVSFSLGAFMTSYGIAALHLDPEVAFLAAALLGAATVATAPLGGWLADRVDRRLSAVASRLALAAFAWPGFVWMGGSGGGTALLFGASVLAALATIGTPAALCLIAEAMPHRSRAGGVSVVYALGISLFGSATQPAATLLLALTGDLRSPAWLLVGAGIVGAAAALAAGPSRT